METQLKLFTIVKDYETLKNMGMVMSVNCQSRGIYGNDYYIKIKKDILNYIDMHVLSDIILDKFIGYYGGNINTKLCNDYIYCHVNAWND